MSEDQTFQVQIIVPNLTNVLSNGIKQRLTSWNQKKKLNAIWLLKLTGRDAARESY